MKTTIIKILNQIANGEQPPKKIIYREKLWEYDNQDKDYFTNCYDGTEWLFDEYLITDILNDEVEILETTITYNGVQRCTEANNKIEKIDVFSYDKCIHGVTNKEKELALEIRYTQIKINEIIDKLNKDQV